MLKIAINYRRGMTLVELLVVVAILGLLAVTVLPTLSTSADARRSREATRTVSSYIAKAQSRAIGRPEWAGLWLTQPPSNPLAHFSIDLYMAEVPSLFRGDTPSSVVRGSPNPSGSAFVLTSSLDGTTVFGTTGDLVRFDGQLPWYEYVNPTTIRLRNSGGDNVNQTTLNTPWPASAVPHTFEVLRQPIRSGSPITLADGRCVDLRWSGCGGSTAASYVPFGTSPGPIAILFDGTGRLRQLFYGGARHLVAGPVYLLIGRTDRAGINPAVLNTADDSIGANWQYSDSYWIAIDPITGVAKTAECTRQAGLATDDVFASQSFIRSEINAGGR
jgi:prepilin-type N-terminal cleavage/methylation domain-containing protein